MAAWRMRHCSSLSVDPGAQKSQEKADSSSCTVFKMHHISGVEVQERLF